MPELHLSPGSLRTEVQVRARHQNQSQQKPQIRGAGGGTKPRLLARSVREEGIIFCVVKPGATWGWCRKQSSVENKKGQGLGVVVVGRGWGTHTGLRGVLNSPSVLKVVGCV